MKLRTIAVEDFSDEARGDHHARKRIRQVKIGEKIDANWSGEGSNGLQLEVRL